MGNHRKEPHWREKKYRQAVGEQCQAQDKLCSAKLWVVK